MALTISEVRVKHKKKSLAFSFYMETGKALELVASFEGDKDLIVSIDPDTSRAMFDQVTEARRIISAMRG